MIIQQEQTQAIKCENTHRLLATIGDEVLYLWCKTCRVSHPIAKSRLLEAFEATHGSQERQEKIDE